jgi:uncharacterized damage-inducible protein DinB
MRTVTLAAAFGALAVSPLFAQPAGGKPFTDGVQRQFQQIQGLIMKSAEKVGEDLYSFKPTPDVRSLGGVIGHVADGNRLLCTAASGQGVDFERIMKGDFSAVQVHEKKTSKAEIIAALNETKAFCESVFAKIDDSTGLEPVPWFGGQKMAKLMILTQANSHTWEHYGNLVTYMRLKNIIPPTSERPPTTSRELGGRN